jgi:hypothetical protein
MLVGLNGRVVGEGKAEAAEDLAVWLVGVSLCAGSGALKVLVENIKRIDVSGSELRAVHVLEESCSLIEGGNVGRANVGAAVSWCHTVVLPAFNLNHGHQVVDGHVSSSNLSSNLLNVEASGAESMVQGLCEEDV